MAIPLKQSTAATVRLGPLVDSTDGASPETALTIAASDVKLSKAGGSQAAKNDATGCTHDAGGTYACPLDATDTNTLGRLRIDVQMSGALPWWCDFEVLPANVYDSLYGSDRLQVDVQEMGAGTVTAAAIANGAIDAATFAAGAIDATAIADTAIRASKFDTAAITATVLAADCIGASQVADGAIHAAALAQNSITANALAVDAVAEIVDDVWDEQRSGHTVAGSFGEGAASVQGNVTGSVGSVSGAVGSVTGAVGSVTGNVGGNVIGSVGSVAAGGITAASIATDAIDDDAIANGAIHNSAFTAQAIDVIWDEVVTGTTTARQAVVAIAADVAGLDGEPMRGTDGAVTSLAGVSTHSAADVWSVATRSLTDKADFGLSSAERTSLAAAIWGALSSGLTAAGSIGKRLVDYITGDIYARLGAPAGASVSADVAAVKAKTDNLPASPAAVGSAMTLANGAVTAAAIASDAITAAKVAADVSTEIATALLAFDAASYEATAKSGTTVGAFLAAAATGLPLRIMAVVDNGDGTYTMTIKEADGVTTLAAVTGADTYSSITGVA